MKVDKTVYNYIEYELYHYKQYKKDIEMEREQILDSFSHNVDGMPRGNLLVRPTENKGIRLAETTTVLAMERIIKAVDNTIKRLQPLHMQIFKLYYIDCRMDKYCICDDLHISPETFKRYRQSIIYGVGYELGLINMLTQS